MRIVTLMENTSINPNIVCKHGLSFYIETKDHKILFDMGPNDDFLKNAKMLGVDISKVDIAILSHGHYDHGGGLPAFLEANKIATVHLQKKAVGDFFALRETGNKDYIGLPQELKDNSRIVYHTGDYKLDCDLQVFAGVTGRECYSPGNDNLFALMNGRFVQDLFMHEQNLLIKEGNKMVLIAGCAHNGIINIMKKADSFVPGGIDYVISGMHLKNAYKDLEKQKMFCKKMAEHLNKRDSQYYTCHCTTVEAYEMLHENMGDKIQYLSAGSILEI